MGQLLDRGIKHGDINSSYISMYKVTPLKYTCFITLPVSLSWNPTFNLDQKRPKTSSQQYLFDLSRVMSRSIVPHGTRIPPEKIHKFLNTSSVVCEYRSVYQPMYTSECMLDFHFGVTPFLIVSTRANLI